jgi:hypothetical protein
VRVRIQNVTQITSYALCYSQNSIIQVGLFRHISPFVGTYSAVCRRYFHGGKDCDTVYSGRQVPTFQRNLLIPPSGWKWVKMEAVCPSEMLVLTLTLVRCINAETHSTSTVSLNRYTSDQQTMMDDSAELHLQQTTCSFIRIFINPKACSILGCLIWTNDSWGFLSQRPEFTSFSFVYFCIRFLSQNLFVCLVKKVKLSLCLIN